MYMNDHDIKNRILQVGNFNLALGDIERKNTKLRILNDMH